MKICDDEPKGKVGSGLPLNASLFTVFICILFGANAVAIKISFTGLGIFTAAAIRFSVAVVAIYLWGRLTGKPLRVKKKQIPQLLFLGLVFYTQLSLFYNGQYKTTASHGTLITNILPFMVMILAHFVIPGEKIVVKRIVGLVCGFCGVMVLFFDSARLTSAMVTGDIIVLTAVMVWSVNAVYTKKIIVDFDPIQITLYPMMIASSLFWVSAFLFDEHMVFMVDWSVVVAMLYQALVTASFGMVAWNTMIRKYGPTQLHSFIYIMPVSGVILGVLILNEPVTSSLIASVILIVAGLIIVNRTTG